MKKYLSFGGGVNSVALYLLLIEQGEDFEAVFVDHKTDWPETYEYVENFRKKYPLTIIEPDTEGFNSVYDYSWHYHYLPNIRHRWCTDKFKVRPIMQYYKKPCFSMLGIDYGEKKRAKLSVREGVENRFPLIEHEMDREGCISIIKRFGLDVPVKSGCYICPFQKRADWKRLRRIHPSLFCKAELLEKRAQEYHRDKDFVPHLAPSHQKLGNIIHENQQSLFKEMEYPPCECGL